MVETGVERVESTAELGHAVAADGPLVIDAKDAVLVAIEGDRLAPGLQIGPGRMEIRERRLALDKLKVHQPARRIVDKYHQGGSLRPPADPCNPVTDGVRGSRFGLLGVCRPV